MRLSTPKSKKVISRRPIIIGFLILSVLFADGTLYFQNSHDLNKNGIYETLLLNSAGNTSASWVELSNGKVTKVLWEYNLPYNGKFADAELIDVNSDNILDIVAIAELSPSNATKDWLYVFLGDGAFFSKTPFTSGYKELSFGIIRPSNISKIPNSTNQVAVAFGTPIRKAIVFGLSINQDDLTLGQITILSEPIIENGYGHIFAGGFISNGSSYLAIVSPEANKIKTAVFNMDAGGVKVKSDIFMVGDAKFLIGAGIQPFKKMKSEVDGLVIPYGTDDVFLLTMDNKNIKLNKTDKTGQSLPQMVEFSGGKLEKKIIQNEDTNDLIPPLPDPIEKERARFEELTSLPYDYKETQFKEKRPVEETKKEVKILTPTLGDYLKSAKIQTLPNDEIQNEKSGVPELIEEMHSEKWADEAGFEQVDLGEYMPEKVDDSKGPIVPNIDDDINLFTNNVRESIAFKPIVQDYSQFEQVKGQIDLYYVLAITPAIKNTKDRYVFDGEAPFGVSVNQIPQIGEPSHFQHGISANLNGLRSGETFDFAYSLRNAQTDSITTLSMIHDLQTNVVFMSISPEKDSLSQSYQPDAFDPTLFEFPDYFFEGFPTSLGMDFKDKLIRFSFTGNSDSVVHKGIYLSSTTPSIPAQSLAVFMDEGKLQAIRGEIVVRNNGSKKITTEFDLDGYVEPSVMFSRLIQEYFPDSLKVQLLQDGSLKEPLFKPRDKLPKVSREQRLPEAQFNQTNPSIPVEPIQSIIPEMEKIDNDSSVTTPEPYVPENINVELFDVTDDTAKTFDNSHDIIDSLKLERRKIVPENPGVDGQDSLPKTEKSQPESSILNPNVKD
tara:strand:+ start:33414 stop:35915 length:2502 start_codon:yes stop_codon:yes gene_type:complete